MGNMKYQPHASPSHTTGEKNIDSCAAAADRQTYVIMCTHLLFFSDVTIETPGPCRISTQKSPIKATDHVKYCLSSAVPHRRLI